MEPLNRVQDPGPFAMTLGYLHLYIQDHRPIKALLPDWTIIAGALEREHYWFELACLACLLRRPVQETQRALKQFQTLRKAVGEELSELPKVLHQQVTSDWRWPIWVQQREAIERQLLLAETPPNLHEWVKAGMLPL